MPTGGGGTQPGRIGHPIPNRTKQEQTMKFRAFNTASGVWVLATFLWVSGPGGTVRAASDASEEKNEASTYEAQQRAAAEQRQKDPAWKPAHEEIAVIRVGKEKETGSLSNFCVAKDGNLLACWSVEDEGRRRGKKTAEANEIRVFSPAGKFLKAIPLSAEPGAICVDQEGNIFVGGGGKLLKLDPQGKELLTADAPAARLPVALPKEMQEILKEADASKKQEVEEYKRNLEQRRGEITGIAVTKQDLFVACPSPNDFSYCIYRTNHQLAEPKQVVEKLRGCCGQMDVQAADDKIWIPHNGRHCVECLDREGKALSKFGKAGRTKADQFGGCCEPKNLRITASGEILAAESGPPTCIKKFSADGKFLGVVAVQESRGNCVRVSVDVSPDGKQFYLLDTEQNAIRVFGTK
jgi:hypothetical protein